jgi:hypothetical protein
VIFISRQLASIDRLLFANLKCSRHATAAHRKERSLQDDEKAREAITEGETLIASASARALTINARGADPENVARCDIFHVLRTREQRRDVAVAQQARPTGAVLGGRRQHRRYPMSRSILGSVAAAALMLSVATASAQTSPDTGGAAALTPEQRAAIRMVIAERLKSEMSQLPDRLSQAADTLSQLTPEQRTAIRAAIRARLTDDTRGGLPAALGERLADRLGIEVQVSPGGAFSPDQLTKLRNAIHARLAEEMRERLADRLADAAATLASLSPEQRAQVLAAVSARLGDEVKDRLGQTLAEEISEKLADKTVGSGDK